ncbi:nuclear transport factor 2 family protein [Nocardioides humi]|uniref:Nuclear transport factor 2 family protein n=1 Tax=Nocardioides humi TaxID=449461 RepID=A0ABN2AGS8_9ACTN|nr:nuclear transport factor 2 family protein [Nocardioides humi]
MELDSDWRELTALSARYARGLDDKDYALLRTCFTATARTSYGTGNAGVDRGDLSYETPEAMIDAMRRIQAPLRTLHRMSNHLFDIDGDLATGRVYLHQFQLREGDGPARTTEYFAWYDDSYVRTAAGWRFQERHATTLWATGGWIGDPAAG